MLVHATVSIFWVFNLKPYPIYYRYWIHATAFMHCESQKSLSKASLYKSEYRSVVYTQLFITK